MKYLKLFSALDTGKVCGLKTVEQAILNMYRGYPQVLPYTEVNGELDGLEHELKDAGIEESMSIDQGMQQLLGSEYTANLYDKLSELQMAIILPIIVKNRDKEIREHCDKQIRLLMDYIRNYPTG